MPSKESLRPIVATAARAHRPESFRFGRQSTALFVSKPESATAKLLRQELVLLAQILGRLLPLLIHPSRKRDQHKTERIENAHQPYHLVSRYRSAIRMFSA